MSIRVAVPRLSNGPAPPSSSSSSSSKSTTATEARTWSLQLGAPTTACSDGPPATLLPAEGAMCGRRRGLGSRPAWRVTSKSQPKVRRQTRQRGYLALDGPVTGVGSV
eukprot:2221378-Prymnesium_polylepis.1